MRAHMVPATTKYSSGLSAVQELPLGRSQSWEGSDVKMEIFTKISRMGGLRITRSVHSDANSFDDGIRVPDTVIATGVRTGNGAEIICPLTTGGTVCSDDVKALVKKAGLIGATVFLAYMSGGTKPSRVDIHELPGTRRLVVYVY